MKFYSIKDPEQTANWRKAVLEGAPPGGGLYLPEKVPTVSEKELEGFRTLSFCELAHEILRSWTGEDFEKDMFDISAKDVFDFPVRCERVKDHWVLELFHGPSLSFKDFGARFLAASIDSALEKEGRNAVLITATSGDTGGAVAKAFAGSKRVKTFVLYPAGNISAIQEKQIITAGGKITALAIEGDFDACQYLVKKALIDEGLRSLRLTSANSINVGRLLPQTLYYIYAYLNIAKPGEKVLFSVPCGNFGNLTGGLLAKKMGFPFEFIAACNENAVATQYFKTGIFEPRPTKHTLSTAMDIGNPSNFARVLALCNYDKDSIARDVNATTSSDPETLRTMETVYKDSGYILDPHGAVAWHGMQQFLNTAVAPRGQTVVLETAHPSKFPETVKRAIGRSSPVPLILEKDLKKGGKSVPMPAGYPEFKEFLLNNC